MAKLRRGVVLGAALVGLCGASAFAADPDEPVHTKLLLVKTPSLAKFLAKPLAGGSFDVPDAMPGAGTSLRIDDTGTGGASAGSNTYDLSPVCGTWKALGTPPKGYKFRQSGACSSTCKIVLVKTRIIKAICKTGVSFTHPFSDASDGPNGGLARVLLRISGGAKEYCAQVGDCGPGDVPNCGTQVRNSDTQLTRKGGDAPAGTSCFSPSGAFLETAHAPF